MYFVKILQESKRCYATVVQKQFFFTPPASIQVVREVGTSLSGVQRARKLGLGGKVKEKRMSTRPRVWFVPRMKGGGPRITRGWDEIEAESELGVGKLDRIGGGCKNQECRGWIWMGGGE